MNNNIDKNSVNNILNLFKIILKFALIIILILLIYMILLVNRELKITNSVFNILKIISPLFFGIILAYILNPIIIKLENKGMKRLYASLLLFLGIIILIIILCYLLFPNLINQIKDISKSVPELVDKINIFVNNFISKFSNTSDFKINIKNEIKFILEKLTKEFPKNCLNIFNNLFSFISCLALSLFIGFYISLDYDKFKDNIYILLPKKHRRKLKKLVKEINEDLFKFIKGTLLLTILVFIISLILFSIFKLKAPIFFALFISFTNIIPYIGPIIGGIPTVIIAFTQNSHTGIFILISILVIQILDNFIFQPIIMGKTMKLHPVTILISLLIFEYFFGIIGMCITVPVIAIIKRIILFIDKRYKIFNFDKLKTVESKK